MENDRAIEAMKQKLNKQLLQKRMEQAAKAQANLEAALEMSRSVDVHSLELTERELEVDDADLFDVDLESALDDIDDLTEDLAALSDAAALGDLPDLPDLPDGLDDLDALDDMDLDDVEDLSDDDFEDDVEELDDDELTTDDLELFESQVSGLRDTLRDADRTVKLSTAEEDEILAAMRGSEPAPLGERSPSKGTHDAVGATGALDAIDQGLRESAQRTAGQPELQAAIQLLEGLTARLREPVSDADGQGVLAAYLDLARVLAASGAALALVVERHLSQDTE